ncbi:MAG: ABC transporter transmembrane domain-containing protein [Reinekea sp.]
MTKLKFILHYFLLNKYSYLFAIVCIFSVNWLQVEIPHYIKNAIDLLGQEGASVHRDIQTNVLVVMVFSLIMVVVRILSRMYALNPGRFVEAKLKSDLFYRLNRLPASVHSQYPSGKLISILNNDLTGIRAFFGIGFLQLTNAFFALSLTPIWMWRLSPSLTLYSIIPLVVAFVVFREGFIRMRKYHRERLKRLQDLSEQLMNVLSGMDLIKNQQMGPWVSDEVNRVNRSLQDVYMKVTRIQTFVLPVLNYGNELMKVIILCLGGYFILQQNMTLGEITAFLSYSTLLAFPMMQLGRMAVVYQMGMVSIDSVQSVLSHQIPATDAESAKSVPVQPQALHVKDLSYCYDGQSEPALSRVSFTIQPGHKIGSGGSRSERSLKNLTCFLTQSKPISALVQQTNQLISPKLNVYLN